MLAEQLQAETDTALAKQTQADLDKRLGGARIYHGKNIVLSVPQDDQAWTCKDGARCFTLQVTP